MSGLWRTQRPGCGRQKAHPICEALWPGRDWIQETAGPSRVPLPAPGEHIPPRVVGWEWDRRCLRTFRLSGKWSFWANHGGIISLKTQGQLFKNVRTKGFHIHSSLEKLQPADQNCAVGGKVARVARPIPPPGSVPFGLDVCPVLGQVEPAPRGGRLGGAAPWPRPASGPAQDPASQIPEEADGEWEEPTAPAALEPAAGRLS